MQLSNHMLILMMFSSIMINGTLNQVVNNSDLYMPENTEIREEIQYEHEYIEFTNNGTGETGNISEISKFHVNGLTLREGIVSEDVLRVKTFLKIKGYNGIIENYLFDTITKEAVMDYQNNNGLTPDGIIGQNTFETINRDIELNKINIPNIYIGFTSEIPLRDWIIINKSSNTLYHLNGENLIAKYPVATGKSPEYTPEGQFTIVTKIINPYWGGAGRYNPVKGGAPNNPLGKRWMGLSIKGGGSYGIHGNSDESSIGKYISLGCIRMFNRDVEYLYDLIDNGTPVWIGSENRLIELGIVFSYSH